MEPNSEDPLTVYLRVNFPDFPQFPLADRMAVVRQFNEGRKYTVDIADKQAVVAIESACFIEATIPYPSMPYHLTLCTPRVANCQKFQLNDSYDGSHVGGRGSGTNCDSLR